MLAHVVGGALPLAPEDQEFNAKTGHKTRLDLT
jgi:hypothetical protein